MPLGITARECSDVLFIQNILKGPNGPKALVIEFPDNGLHLDCELLIFLTPLFQDTSY